MSTNRLCRQRLELQLTWALVERFVLLLELERVGSFWEDVMEPLSFLASLSLPGRLSWEGLNLGVRAGHWFNWIWVSFPSGFLYVPKWGFQPPGSLLNSLPHLPYCCHRDLIPHSSSPALRGFFFSRFLAHLTRPIIPAHAPQPDCSSYPQLHIHRKTTCSQCFCFCCGLCM